jgi:hypothetical protein
MKLFLARFECDYVEGKDGSMHYVANVVFQDHKGQVVVFAIFFSYNQVLEFVRRHKFGQGERITVLQAARHAAVDGLLQKSRLRGQVMTGLAAQTVYLQTLGLEDPEVVMDLESGNGVPLADGVVDWHAPEFDDLRAEFWPLMAGEALR